MVDSQVGEVLLDKSDNCVDGQVPSDELTDENDVSSFLSLKD